MSYAETIITERCDAADRDVAPKHADRGTMTPWFVGMVVVIMGVAGLGLDMWRVVSERRALSEAADASARAGANAIDLDVFDESGALVLDPGLAQTIARDNLDRQDESAIRSLSNIDISSTTDIVVVELDGRVETTLLRLVGVSSFDLTVQGEASPRGSFVMSPAEER